MKKPTILLAAFLLFVLLCGCPESDDDRPTVEDQRQSEPTDGMTDTPDSATDAHIADGPETESDEDLSDDVQQDLQTDTSQHTEGWLYTEDNHIYTSDGAIWRGRGVNMHDTRSCWACSWSDPDVAEVKGEDPFCGGETMGLV